ncbi:uncharacterized protein LOC118750249 [Rhagoletis pomonella]|uniref:uncharacterized protein LOC118750249 n=1 Tax=Rhagoletis pomonella TaxID=28610 RepID=UPI0017832BE5|nr:uncharacterized protein LOC118750249 [Rhagoletis pomonella]
MASPRGIKMLLNHFVRGRLYDRDLRDNEVFETIGGGHIKITRNPGSNATSVNNAKITESEVFVYNLGTMFYIDDILYAHLLREYVSKPTKIRSDPNGSAVDGGQRNGDYIIGDQDDEFEDEIITPKALPVQIYELPQ